MAEKKEESKSSSGMDPKLVALLCWIFAPITSIIFMLIEEMKEDEFIQFNAKESLWYGIANFVLFAFAIIPCLGAIIVLLGSIAFLIGRIVIGIKAYNGEKVVLPIIGDMASK